jgi:hypothetical protein
MYRSSVESGFLFPELLYTHLALEDCIGNAVDSVRRCREKYHNRSMPDYGTFLPIDLLVREMEALYRMQLAVGPLHILCNVQIGEKVLKVVERQDVM